MKNLLEEVTAAATIHVSDQDGRPRGRFTTKGAVIFALPEDGDVAGIEVAIIGSKPGGAILLGHMLEVGLDNLVGDLTVKDPEMAKMVEEAKSAFVSTYHEAMEHDDGSCDCVMHQQYRKKKKKETPEYTGKEGNA